MKAKQSVVAAKPAAPFRRMELGYCPRCGTLHVRPAESGRELCAACARTLLWLYEGNK
jgi:hypothetical protein